MPVYAFECLKCGHKFEHVMPVGEYEKKVKEGITCPKCQSGEVEQQLLATVQTSKKS